MSLRQISEDAWLSARAKDESGEPIYDSFDEYWNCEGRELAILLDSILSDGDELVGYRG